MLAGHRCCVSDNIVVKSLRFSSIVALLLSFTGSHLIYGISILPPHPRFWKAGAKTVRADFISLFRIYKSSIREWFSEILLLQLTNWFSFYLIFARGIPIWFLYHHFLHGLHLMKRYKIAVCIVQHFPIKSCYDKYFFGYCRSFQPSWSVQELLPLTRVDAKMYLMSAIRQ